MNMANPTAYAQALRKTVPMGVSAPAPAPVPHNFGVPNGGGRIPMPDGGVRAPAGGIPLPDTAPRPYPMGGGVSMPAPPRTPETYRPQGVSMPVPPRTPETYRPNGVSMPVPPRTPETYSPNGVQARMNIPRVY